MAKEGEGPGINFGTPAIQGGQLTDQDANGQWHGTIPTDWPCPDLAIPAEFWRRLEAYLQAGNHGNVTLNIKDGKVISWQLTEIGRIDKRCMPTVD